ncbi:MAG: MaoC family dehydratase [Actinomycetes bacterium]|jgi:acyl dehydratase|nr:MAG: dehydratase [Actinomycetota bacterium]
MEEVLERLQGLVGTEIGVSDWMEITQERVNLFADATDDHQFIHVNPELAAQTPFGGTIAHGFLTLSLIVPLLMQIPLDVGYPVMGINYGLNKVRFPAPVPVGKKVRARYTLDAVEQVAPNGIQMTRTVTVEVEDNEKPACVAESLVRLYY